MFISAQLGESWSDLAGRLDARDALRRWAQHEPALVHVTSVAALREGLSPAAERHVCDDILGALLRLGSLHGGDDGDAVLVVLHLIEPGASRLARRFGADMVVGELAVQIRSWTGREWMHAANLLFDTERALCRELRAPRRHRGWHDPAILVDPTDLKPTGWLSILDRATDDSAAHTVRELVDLLLWAERTGVVDARDLSMLVEYHLSRETCSPGEGGGHAHVAAVFGVSKRTSMRRCAAASAALLAAFPAALLV
jgi:hypothetical protein